MAIDNSTIVIHDDQDYNDAIFDISDRIFELRDRLSVDIVAKNIKDQFAHPVNYETINYVAKFKEACQKLKEENYYDGDIDIVNDSMEEIAKIVVICLENTYSVGVGGELDEDDDFRVSFDDYIEKIEAFYEFFVVRHYSILAQYFKSEIQKNKTAIVEKYMGVLDENPQDDLFFNQDKKKYVDKADAIIIHFIQDIIEDIKSKVTSGYEFFKDLAQMDKYELMNNRMCEYLENYGTDFNVINDQEAATKYLNILNDNELKVSLRNDVLSYILMDAKLV